MTAATNPEGRLPGALNHLHNAVKALCGPQALYLDNQLRRGPSLYVQLWDATMGEQSNAGTGGGSKSRPPFWTDAFDLRNEIDTAVECWQPAYQGVPPTVGRLNCLLEHPWRPQDIRQISQITTAVESWVTAIGELMNPTPKWTLPNPCPACGRAIVYRRDSGGELVRQPALKIGVNGCTCQHCHATWAPERFVFLARVLGSLPDGVLE